MRVRAFLFDYGNVLVRWDPRNLYRKIFREPSEMERFLSEICTLDWHGRHDAGEVMAETTAAIVDELGAAGMRRAMLTNMPADKAGDCFKPFTRRSAFDPIVVSGVEKIVKPDPRIYELALGRMRTVAADVLFVDDSMQNVAAAQKLGMRADTYFIDAPTFRSALRDEGLL